MMQVGVADDARRLAPDHQVGIGANCNRALPRVQAVGLGWIGRREFDETVDRDAPVQHAMRVQQRQPRLEAGNAVRNVAERDLLTARLLALGCVVAECCVVRREDREQAVGQAVPDHLLVVAVARRWAADAARTLVAVVDAEILGG